MRTDEEDRSRLVQVLASYGGDPGRWPAGDRERLAALLERSPEARGLQREAAALDRLLDGQPRAGAPPEIRAAILAAAPAPRRRGIGSWLRPLVVDLVTPVGLRPAGAILALSLLCGIAVGGLLPAQPEQAAGDSQSNLLQFAFMNDRYAGY